MQSNKNLFNSFLSYICFKISSVLLCIFNERGFFFTLYCYLRQSTRVLIKIQPFFSSLSVYFLKKSLFLLLFTATLFLVYLKLFHKNLFMICTLKVLVYLMITSLVLAFIVITKTENKFSVFFNRTRILMLLLNFAFSYQDSIISLFIVLTDSDLYLFVLYYLLLLVLGVLSSLFSFVTLSTETNISLTLFKEILYTYLLILLLPLVISRVDLSGITFFGTFIADCAGDKDLDNNSSLTKGSNTPKKNLTDFLSSNVMSFMIKKSINNLDVFKDVGGIEIDPALKAPLNTWHSNGPANLIVNVLPSNYLHPSLSRYLRNLNLKDNQATEDALDYVRKHNAHHFSHCCDHLVHALRDSARAAGVSSISKSEPAATVVDYTLRYKNNGHLALVFSSIKNGNHTGSINEAAIKLQDCMTAADCYLEND